MTLLRPLRLLLALLPLVAGCIGPDASPDTTSPYAGEELRPIKALSAEEVDDLLEGRGMGLAKAAELNGYPGPLHVLELADDLRISPGQRAATERIRGEMLDEAKRLGREVLALEAELEAAFADGSADEARVAQLTGLIGARMGELRAVHLDAHVALRPVLSEDQLRHYAALRGYSEEGGAAGDDHASHAGHGG